MGQFTPFAGLYELNAGESVAENAYQFYDNEQIIDNYINSFVTHRHDGSPAMLGFASNPTLTANAASGTLTAGETYYVGITAIDIYGGETLSSSALVVLPGAVSDPTIPASAAAQNDNTGYLTAGTYRYTYTLVTASGETLPAPVTNVSIHTNGHILITANTGSANWRLYRSFGYSPLTRLGNTISGPTNTFNDDGSSTVYIDQPPPDENTTGDICSITVNRPSLPASADAWRIYFSKEQDMPDPSLWSTDGVTKDIYTYLSSVLITDDSETIDGTPPLTSHTIPGASLLYAQDVSYGGNLPYIGSGSVEAALDYLSEYVSSAFTLNASGSSRLPGHVQLIGSGGVVITQNNVASTITITGGNASSATINGSAGVISIVGSGATTVTSSNGVVTVSSVASAATVNNISASGYSQLSGDVTIVGSGIISVTQTGQVINLFASAGTGNVTTVHASGATDIIGNISFIAGSGITLVQSDAASSITINTTGVGPASAGVNSISIPAGSPIQTDIGLYGSAGITISQSGSAFTFIQGASAIAVNTLNGSGGVMSIVGSANVTVSSAAGVLTVYSPLEVSSIRASGSTAMRGDVTLVAGTSVTLVESLAASTITINSIASGGGGALTLKFLNMQEASKIMGAYIGNLLSPASLTATIGRVYKFYCPGSLTINQVIWKCQQTTATCMQLGIFDSTGTQVWTSGAQGGDTSVNNGWNSIVANLPVSLTEGIYFMMLTNNNSGSSNTPWSVSDQNNIPGCGTYVVTAGAIPASLTVGSITRANVGQLVQVVLDAT